MKIVPDRSLSPKPGRLGCAYRRPKVDLYELGRCGQASFILSNPTHCSALVRVLFGYDVPPAMIFPAMFTTNALEFELYKWYS
jgi:hypothetical protein